MAKLTRKDGGLKGLASRAGIERKTFYPWFNGTSEPDLKTLTALAKALKVTRTEIVAAMDGVVAPADWRDEMRQELVQMVRAATRATLAEVQAEGGLTRSALPESPVERSA